VERRRERWGGAAKNQEEERVLGKEPLQMAANAAN
jgi:hypothetical protein